MCVTSVDASRRTHAHALVNPSVPTPTSRGRSDSSPSDISIPLKQGDESDFPDLSAGLVTVACDEERDAESAGASGTRPRESRE